MDSAAAAMAGLAASAFLSATLLPGNSEIVLAAVLKAFPGDAAPAIALATLANTLGGLTTFAIGWWLPHGKAPAPRALAWVRRYGAFALLLAWLPVVGDALCAAAGWVRVKWWAAAAAMAVGKLARYLAVAQAAAAL